MCKFQGFLTGKYSITQVPSWLSLQTIFASDGPSMAKPRLPWPAPFVSIVNVVGSFVIACSRPGP